MGFRRKIKILQVICKLLWYKYSVFVAGITRGNEGSGPGDINYWRDKLFTNFITWLLPVCLVPLVPGVIVGIKAGYPLIATVDLIAATIVFAIGLYPKLNLTLRKFLIAFILYCLAAFLMIFLGLLGPGFIYLLALSVFVTLTFPGKYAYYTVAINFLLSLCCALIIYFRLFNSPLINEFNLGAWIAVSSNLIFLSLVCVVLIINIFKGLEDTISKEHGLKNQLQQESIERLRNNQLLKESEGHYRSLFFRSPSPMWVFDNETLQFLQVNEAAIKNYGYTSEEFLAMRVGDIRLTDDVPGFFEALPQNHEHGQPLIKINQHRRKCGENFYAEVCFNDIPFRGKQATLGIARDMTEQINYIKAIEGQNEKLHEIAYIQSHYVRAPLARIIGLVDLLNHNSNETPSTEVLAYLDQSAKEFDEVIRTITNKTEQIFIN